MAQVAKERFVQVALLADVRAKGCLVVRVEGHSIALFSHNGCVYAVANRCPHMGFPLDKGTVKDGVLTCHWHHARFDLSSGGTFDQFAGDVPVYPVAVRGDEVWVDIAPRGDRASYHRERLQVGLERNVPLVIGKSVIALLDEDQDATAAFRIGLDFGAKYLRGGWRQGLTIHTCMMNLVPHLEAEDRPRALYHGLSAIARECAGEPPRFSIRPLPEASVDIGTFKRWFRQFVEVRDGEGAERCLVSAVRAGATSKEMADMLFAAATDHRYIQIGHVADFTNKALDALDIAGWEYAEAVLSSLAGGYAGADRMEESNSWRNPVDLVSIVENAFGRLQPALDEGRKKRGMWHDHDALVAVISSDRPESIADGLLDALREGATEDELAAAVSSAAALRVARFHTSNEFGDWDTALHTFTFANAIQGALRRTPSPEVLRGVFDAAMSVYLDRFLNVPPAPIPKPGDSVTEPNALMEGLSELFDRQQQVNEAGRLVARYLYGGGDPDRLLARLCGMLLREDRDFHTIQMVEAAVLQHKLLGGKPEAVHVLVAAARYLAAHAPTVRAQGQTYQIAYRLHRGERLYEGADQEPSLMGKASPTPGA